MGHNGFGDGPVHVHVICLSYEQLYFILLTSDL